MTTVHEQAADRLLSDILFNTEAAAMFARTWQRLASAQFPEDYPPRIQTNLVIME